MYLDFAYFDTRITVPTDGIKKHPIQFKSINRLFFHKVVAPNAKDNCLITASEMRILPIPQVVAIKYELRYEKADKDEASIEGTVFVPMRHLISAIEVKRS